MQQKKERAGATGEKLRRPLLERGDGFRRAESESAAFPAQAGGEAMEGVLLKPTAVFTVNDAAKEVQVSKGL